MILCKNEFSVHISAKVALRCLVLLGDPPQLLASRRYFHFLHPPPAVALAHHCRIMPSVIVTPTGLYWQLSNKKFIVINYEVGTGRRVAGVFWCGVFGGWTGDWCHTDDGNILILVQTTKMDCEFHFDGKLQIGLASAHYFRPMRPMLEDTVLTQYSLLDIVVKDQPIRAKEIDWIVVQPPTPDSTPSAKRAASEPTTFGSASMPHN